MVLKENVLDIDTYLALRKSVGWRQLSKCQAEHALKASLITITAYDGDKPIGMGRLIGDGAVICYIQDLVVVPDAQLSGVGSAIIDRLIRYAKSLREPGTTMMLCLMCAKGREPFYMKHNFTPRPTDQLGPGMIMYLEEPLQ